MINCVIVDDEPLAAALIERYVKDYGNIHVAGKAYNVQDIVRFLHTTQVHLMFLDIQLPGVTGISFLSTLHNAPAVIFTTAHREYAVQAFDLGVVDYLLKPISYSRFTMAVDKFMAAFSKQDAPLTGLTEQPVLLKSGTEHFKILPSEILFIQSQKDYIYVVTAGKKYMVRTTLKNILGKLPGDSFVQVHRSYIIPTANVTSVSVSYVKLNNIKIPVGPSYQALIREKFGV